MYTQVVGTWLCAWRSGMAADSLAESVRRTGLALVLMDSARGQNAEIRRRVRERLHEEYVTVASTGVWGSLEEDIVYCTFYRQDADARGKGKKKLTHARLGLSA